MERVSKRSIYRLIRTNPIVEGNNSEGRKKEKKETEKRAERKRDRQKGRKTERRTGEQNNGVRKQESCG